MWAAHSSAGLSPDIRRGTLLNRLRLWGVSCHYVSRLPRMLKGTEHDANLSFLKCAADLCLPFIRRNGSVLSVFQNQSTLTLLKIKSTVNSIKKVRLWPNAESKAKGQWQPFDQTAEAIHLPKGTHQTAAHWQAQLQIEIGRTRWKWHLLLRGKHTKYNSRCNMDLH